MSFIRIDTPQRRPLLRIPCRGRPDFPVSILSGTGDILPDAGLRGLLRHSGSRVYFSPFSDSGRTFSQHPIVRIPVLWRIRSLQYVPVLSSLTGQERILFLSEPGRQGCLLAVQDGYIRFSVQAVFWRSFLLIPAPSRADPPAQTR